MAATCGSASVPVPVAVWAPKNVEVELGERSSRSSAGGTSVLSSQPAARLSSWGSWRTADHHFCHSVPVPQSMLAPASSHLGVKVASNVHSEIAELSPYHFRAPVKSMSVVTPPSQSDQIRRNSVTQRPRALSKDIVDASSPRDRQWRHRGSQLAGEGSPSSRAGVGDSPARALSPVRGTSPARGMSPLRSSGAVSPLPRRPRALSLDTPVARLSSTGSKTADGKGRDLGVAFSQLPSPCRPLTHRGSPTMFSVPYHSDRATLPAAIIATASQSTTPVASRATLGLCQAAPREVGASSVQMLRAQRGLVTTPSLAKVSGRPSQGTVGCPTHVPPSMRVFSAASNPPSRG